MAHSQMSKDYESFAFADPASIEGGELQAQALLNECYPSTESMGHESI